MMKGKKEGVRLNQLNKIWKIDTIFLVGELNLNYDKSI